MMWAATICEVEKSAEVMQALFGAGADINARSPEGSTVLDLAVRTNNAGAARWLLEHHADATRVNRVKAGRMGGAGRLPPP